MHLNDLLQKAQIDPRWVFVMRHTPTERRLSRVLPWIAAEHQAAFNAYQSFQGSKLEKSMLAVKGKGYVASFIGQDAKTALFVGLYKINGSRALTRGEYWATPENQFLASHGMAGFADTDLREHIHHFDLQHCGDFYAEWKGRMIIQWPPPQISWWRRAHRSGPNMAIHAVLEESALEERMPVWSDISLEWKHLDVIPKSWLARMDQWRCIYFIKDTVRNLGYVGSAYGKFNLVGRWKEYAVTGHGDNKHLRDSDKANLVFSILQLLPPDMEETEVFAAETNWKRRLDTAWPRGLNAN